MTQPQQPDSDQDDRKLAPIPSDGTSAPSDSERVFGKPTGTGSPQSGGQQSGGPQSGGPQSGGQQSGGSGRNREPLSEEDQRALRNRGRMAIILGFGGLFISVLFVPGGLLIGLPLGLAAGVMGVGALVRGRRAGTTVPGATPAIVIGVLSLTLTVAIGVISMMFADELRRASECLGGANTRIAQQSCIERLDEDLQQRGYDLDLSEVPGGTSGAAGFLDGSSAWPMG